MLSAQASCVRDPLRRATIFAVNHEEMEKGRWVLERCECSDEIFWRKLQNTECQPVGFLVAGWCVRRRPLGVRPAASWTSSPFQQVQTCTVGGLAGRVGSSSRVKRSAASGQRAEGRA